MWPRSMQWPGRSGATTLGGSNWEVRLKMATLVELPKIGIRGNSHFLMQELNNDVIAAHVAKCLKETVTSSD